MASRVQPGTALPGLTLEPQRGEPTRHGAPSSAPSASAPLPPVGPVGRTEHRPSRTELGGLEGAAAQAASLEIPTHSISTLRGSSRSVWSSNRWLEECKVGLKATESLCWSQLLQSFTGEPVKWAPKGPNKRQLSRKAVQGILAHQQSKHRGTSLAEDRKIKKEGSRDMALVDTEDKPEQASTTKSLKKGSTSFWAKSRTDVEYCLPKRYHVVVVLLFWGVSSIYRERSHEVSPEWSLQMTATHGHPWNLPGPRNFEDPWASHGTSLMPTHVLIPPFGPFIFPLIAR